MHTPDFRPHEEGPLFDTDDDISDLVEGIDTSLIISDVSVENEEARLSVDLLSAESFALWLGNNFPQYFGRESQISILDAHTLYEAMKNDTLSDALSDYFNR